MQRIQIIPEGAFLDMNGRWIGLGATLALVGIAAGPAGAAPALAQEEAALGEPVARHPEAFGLIGGVRELSNGQVLVADPLGGILVRLDADLHRAERLGAEGQGPREYRQPDAVWPLAADSSLLVDLGNARLTVIDPDGRLGETSPIVLPGEGAGPGGMRMAIPSGTDRQGRVYFEGSRVAPEGMRDSVEVLRLDRATGAIEALATVRLPEVQRRESGGANDRSVSIRQIPLASEDAWGVAPDGGVFIAREADYRVAYIPPAGAPRTGAPMDVSRVRIGSDEREEWDAERSRNGGIAINVSEENGRRSVSMSRGGGGGSSDPGDLPWPEEKPYFYGERIRVDADGHGWVRRHVDAGEPALYDVFDPTGRHVRSVRLPEGRVLVGFGDGSVYLAAVDPFDQHYLEKYAMP